MSEDESWSIHPGDVIDSYIVEHKLGEGGMGVVFKGHHKVTMHEVAIKILLASAASNPGLIARFEREASAGNRIRSDAFVKPIHFGAYQGRPFLVMEYLEGVTLAAEAKQSPIPVQRAVWILSQIADALQAAHDQGIIHRDLKPDNVFLVSKNQFRDIVKILDLGIAKFVNDTAREKTLSNAVIGTPHTMSPEQCRGSNIDHRSDIYALGVVAYYIISGRWPIDGEYFGDITTGHMKDEPPSLHQIAPWVPAGLADAIHRALAKDPAARFQSMRDFSEALSRYAEPSGPARVTGGTPTVQAVRRETSAQTPTGNGEQQARATRSPASRAALIGFGTAAVVALSGAGIYIALSHRTAATIVEQVQPAVKVEGATTHAQDWRVFIDVAPSDATVSVDGVARADKPPIILEGPVGKQFRIRASRDGYEPVEKTVAVENEDRRVPIRLEPLPNAEPSTEQQHTSTKTVESTNHPQQNGTLAVSVLPWANVVVDGKPVGSTPIRALTLKPGVHTVELIHEGLGKHETLTKRIEPGRRQTIKLDWNN